MRLLKLTMLLLPFIAVADYMGTLEAQLQMCKDAQDAASMVCNPKSKAQANVSVDVLANQIKHCEETRNDIPKILKEAQKDRSHKENLTALEMRAHEIQGEIAGILSELNANFSLATKACKFGPQGEKGGTDKEKAPDPSAAEALAAVTGKKASPAAKGKQKETRHK